MKDLLKQYVSKGYEPTFLVIVTELNGKEYLNDFIPTDDDDFHSSVSNAAEKLELYLMRDWLENKGIVIETTLTDIGKFAYDIIFLDNMKKSNVVFDYKNRTEALKSALEEAIKHI